MLSQLPFGSGSGSDSGSLGLLSKANMDKIRHIPCIAVQGAQDYICPPDTALDLLEVWPEMELRVVTKGRHSMYDEPILRELVRATDVLASRDRLDSNYV
eukprot:1094629_1